MVRIVQARPVTVYCSGAQDVNHLDETYQGKRPDIVDNSFTVVEFSNGTRAMLDLCMFAEASRNQEEISAVGDAGKIEALIPDARVFIGKRNIGEITNKPPTHHQTHGAVVEELETVDPKIREAG
jgi:myo-inositol 2-dehydrogenase/D-chiro-inositol 1-dehydrogenase